MFAVQLLIPLSDNDSKRFSPEHHNEFERFVVERIGGLTLLPGEAAGVWTDAGITYRDTMLIYLIAVDSITQGHLIAEIAEFAKRHYRQKALYVSYLGYVEIL